MTTREGKARRVAAAALLGVAAAAPAAAEDISLQGQTVRVMIGSGVGGGYDTWGRLVASHIGKHLPGNPDVIAENLPGAGSLVLANHLYTVAPADGTVFGLIARDAPMEPLLGNTNVQFDPRNFTWVGSTTTETNVCFAHRDSGIASVDDLRSGELIVGDTGPATGSYKYPKALIELLDLNFRIISGYPSSSDIALAIEQGELQGMCESYDSLASRHPDWIEDGVVTIILQGGLEANPALGDVPLALDLARTEQERQAITFLYAGQFFGRPFIAPPGLGPDRAEMLQAAFDATMQDPEFLEDAARLRFDVDPVSGSDLADFLRVVYDTPQEIIDHVTDITR